MDSERLGRVLGIGARLAAKTVVSAVDAATAPGPSAKAESPEATSSGTTSRVRPVEKTVPIKAQVRQTRKGLKREGKRFGEAIWGPFARLGGVLWLEFTGVFFGLFAVSIAVGLWRMRSTLHGAGASHEGQARFLLMVGVALLFGYFCLSSFLRAGRRSKRR